MDSTVVTEFVETLTATAAPPPTWVVPVTAAVALAAVLFRPVWAVLRTVITVVHEGGHAVAALLTGRRLRGIRLHSDTSGLTLSSGRPRGFGMIVTAAAGYPAPALLGLGFAALLADGRVTLLLWTALALLTGVLVAVRNAYGLLIVLIVGGLVFAVTWYGDGAVRSVFAYLAVWFLLLAAVRPVVELQRTRRLTRRRGGAADSDADQLAALTGIPAVLWVGVFGLVCLGAAVTGGVLVLDEAFDLPW